MRKIYILFFLTIVAFKSFTQHAADNWYFGNHAALNFSSGSPAVLSNSVMVTDEGCSSISDDTGMLLFYTNGDTVFNRNHNIMLNGTGFLGHQSSTQSALIVQ